MLANLPCVWDTKCCSFKRFPVFSFTEIMKILSAGRQESQSSPFVSGLGLSGWPPSLFVFPVLGTIAYCSPENRETLLSPFGKGILKKRRRRRKGEEIMWLSSKNSSFLSEALMGSQEQPPERRISTGAWHSLACFAPIHLSCKDLGLLISSGISFFFFFLSHNKLSVSSNSLP